MIIFAPEKKKKSNGLQGYKLRDSFFIQINDSQYVAALN
jgi:hypothetical protein